MKPVPLEDETTCTDRTASVRDPLEVYLPTFLQTFHCPCCGRADFAERDPKDRYPLLMVIFECACGMEVTFLYDHEGGKIGWRGVKQVIAKGRPWVLVYDSWRDKTLYVRGHEEHVFPGFLSPERFENLVVFT